MALSPKLAAGALAGVIGAFAMTAAMRRMKKALPMEERYPLPPREVSEVALRRGGVSTSEDGPRSSAMLSHFAYGALTGALYPLLKARSAADGALFGVAVWAASYFGWIPAAGVLKPAQEHPPRRNALMIMAHLVWGIATDVAYREVRKAEFDVFGGGPLKDVRNL